MAKRKSTIDWQKLRERAGSTGSYDRHIDDSSDKKNAANKTGEDYRANPDGLEDGAQLWGNSEITNPQRIMGEAIEHLQGRQKEVYYLIMREQMSEVEVAELMGITQQAVNTYKMRAIKFITTYCQNAIAKGEKA